MSLGKYSNKQILIHSLQIPSELIISSTFISMFYFTQLKVKKSGLPNQQIVPILSKINSLFIRFILNAYIKNANTVLLYYFMKGFNPSFRVDLSKKRTRNNC